MDNPAPRFDSNLAWQQATAALRANREVLLALAGVFFLLPNLAFSLLFPQPVPPAGADQKAIVALQLAYLSRTAPLFIPMLAVQAAGTLSMLILLAHRHRPTVGEAIGAGFRTALPYVASQLIPLLVIGLAAVLVAFATQAGAKGLGAIGLVIVFAGAVYCSIRLSLAAPVMAVEGLRNPLGALARSWRLTRRNTLRIFVFLLLLLLAFALVGKVVTLLAGLLFAVLLPAQYALFATELVSATVGALMALTLVAALATTHAQLAGTGGEDPDAT